MSVFIVNLFLFLQKGEVITFYSSIDIQIPCSSVESDTNLISISAFSPDTDTCTYDSLFIQNFPSNRQDSLFTFNYQNLKNYIFSNLCYPPEAQEKGIEGEVHVHFCVQKDGKNSHIRIVKSVHPLLDSIVFQLLQTMPRWQPFIQEPIPDSLSYTIPVLFELKNKH